MNQKIKFRAQNIHTGEWLYGDYHREGKTHYITKPDQYLREYAPIEFIVDEKTVGQFTGLLDKNQKSIYEGDIVEWQGDKYAIEFRFGAFLAIERNDKGLHRSLPLSSMGFQHWWDEEVNQEACEIVGNIYNESDISSILKESGEGVDELPNCLANELLNATYCETPYTNTLRTIKAVNKLMEKDGIDPKEASWGIFEIYLDKLEGGES